MFIFTISCFLFASASLASPLARRVNQNEHVILANCVDASGIKYSEMAYFSSQPSSQSPPTPETIAYLNTPFNTDVIWAGSSVSATFPDGDIFTSNVQTAANPGDYAGPGSNSLGGFNCFYVPLQNLYIDGPGTPIPLTCSQVYDCSHAPVPAPVPTVEWFFEAPVQQFDGTGATAHDFFSAIYQHMNNTACDEQAVTIPNTGDISTGAADCTITFNCAGGPDGRTVKAMADSLVEVVSGVSTILQTRSVPITPYCITPGPPEPALAGSAGQSSSPCALMSGDTKIVSYIQSHMSMDITNYGEGGNLEYTINCPAPPMCTFCDQTAAEMDDVSKAPVIGGIFGGIGELINKASCSDSGCSEPI